MEEKHKGQLIQVLTVNLSFKSVRLSMPSMSPGFIMFMLWHFSINTVLDVGLVFDAFKAVWSEEV